MPHKKRKQFNARLKELENIQQPHIGPWKDMRDYEAPNRGNLIEDKGREGQRMDLKIYNGTPALSARQFGAGMNSRITSPSRPWFRLATANRDLMERADVQAYIRAVEEKMYQIFNQSNFYTQAALLYLEIGVFGTAVMSIKADFKDIVRFDTYSVGEYYIAINHRAVVDVLYRRIWKTPIQLVEEFGKENVSKGVLDQLKSRPDFRVKIIHVVEPNDDRVPNMIDAKNKAYRSVYYEEESLEKDKEFLRESGFDSFPYVAPRWSTKGSDAYGTDQPGLLALGDSKQLQSGTFEKAKGLQRNMNPPLQGPSDLKNARIGNVPGGFTFVNRFGGDQGGIKPLYETRVPLKDIIEDNRGMELRIQEAFFADLFRSISLNSRPQDMKAEVALQIDQERLLQLGPVLESLNDDFLDPAIDRVFDLAEERGEFPEAPEDLKNEVIRPEYVSALAKAQKTAAISSMERLAGFAGFLEPLLPGTTDKLKGDQMIDEAAEILDVPSGIINSDEEVDVIRQAKQQIKDNEQMLVAGVAAAGAAKDLANAPVGKGALIDQLVGTP